MAKELSNLVEEGGNNSKVDEDKAEPQVSIEAAPDAQEWLQGPPPQSEKAPSSNENPVDLSEQVDGTKWAKFTAENEWRKREKEAEVEAGCAKIAKRARKEKTETKRKASDDKHDDQGSKPKAKRFGTT